MFTCPHCQRHIYDRTRPHCGYCGAELPPETLLTAEQQAALAEEEEKQAKRHADWSRHQEQLRKRDTPARYKNLFE